MAEKNLHPGVTYFYPTKEVDDEVKIENGHPFRHEMDDIESGVFVGSHGRYYMFVIERIAEYHSDKHRFELVYINKNKNPEIRVGDYEDQLEIPLLDDIIRLVNSKYYEHPPHISNYESTLRAIVTSKDIAEFRRKRASSRKIERWITIRPPSRGSKGIFSGGPNYKRAAKNYKKETKGYKEKQDGGYKTRKIRKNRKN